MGQPTRRPARRTCAAVLAASLSLCAIVLATSPPQGAAATERQRLLELQRQAVGLLQNAQRPETTTEALRAALLDAGQRLAALGAEPAAAATPGGGAAAAPLAADLRAELRRAARELASLAEGELQSTAKRDAHSRLELHALGDRRRQQHDLARAELGARQQLAEVRAAARTAVPVQRRAHQAALPVPDAVQVDYVPEFQFRGGRTGNAGQYQTDRGPFTNENITHDVIANVTKVWGSHASKAGFYFQHSYKPQSIFASFNGRINFADDANNPFDSGYGYANAALGAFNTYTQASKYALPEWRSRTSSGTSRTTGNPTTG